MMLAVFLRACAVDELAPAVVVVTGVLLTA